MPTLLIKNARLVATFDNPDPTKSRELSHASVFVRDNFIEAIGAATELAQDADEVIDARGHLVMPGMVNTHHHMYQSLTRAIPATQNAELFGWLRGLYPIWAGLTLEMIQTSTQVAMAELLMSGCPTSSHHLYIYPNGARLDDSIEAAMQISMRFTAGQRSSARRIHSRESVGFCACFKPLFDQQALSLGNAGGVVHRHDFCDDHLLVHGLGVLLDQLGGVQSYILHLQLRAVTHITALLKHFLYISITNCARSPRFYCPCCY